MKSASSLKLEDLSFDSVVTEAEADRVGGSRGHCPGGYGRLRSFLRRFGRRGGHGPMMPSMPLPSGPIPVEPNLPDGSPNPGNFPPTLPPFAMMDEGTQVIEFSGAGFSGHASFSVSSH